MAIQDAYLILFLTEGTSLQGWARTGLLQREAELYQRVRPHVGGIAWVSYGGQADLAFAPQLPGIDILVNRWRLPNPVYVQHLPWLHPAAFQRATILKAEQTGAAAAAMRVAGYYGKRFVARSGFSLALFAQYAPHAYETSYHSILDLERRAFVAAQQVVVTTEEMRQTALQTHPIPAEKIRVIPNYVNTASFIPAEQPPEKSRILFAGRLTEQKNVDALLSAVAPLTEVEVHFIGDGELRGHLESRIAREGLGHVRLVGNVPHTDLPAQMQAATLYAQPSLYEGHPKTIFEAMACGLPVLTSDAPGIRQFVRHGDTGWVCDTDAESIRAGLVRLLGDAALRARLGRAARAQVVAQYALEVIVPQELAMLEAILAQQAPPAQPLKRPWLRSGLTYAARVGRLLRRQIGR